MAVGLSAIQNRFSGKVIILLSAMLAVLGAVPAMLQRFVDQFVYYPMRYPAGDWDARSRAGAEDVWLTTRDGIRLNAWWFPLPGAKLATLFLHGNAGNVTHRVDHAEAVKRAGSAILVLDYRGYGRSDGRPSENGLYRDAGAGYDELLRRGYPPNRIILHGESLGTAVSTDLASRRECAALVLESPFASLNRMAARIFPVLGPILAHGFNTERKIRTIHSPLLIIHGDADKIVPFSQGQAVFRCGNEPKRFWRVPDAQHNDLLYTAGDDYPNQLREFYDAIGGISSSRISPRSFE